MLGTSGNMGTKALSPRRDVLNDKLHRLNLSFNFYTFFNNQNVLQMHSLNTAYSLTINYML